MRDKIVNAIWSLSGLSIGIGVVGVLSGVVTIFVNVNEQLSVKWLLFVILLSLVILLILMKVIFDLLTELELSHEKNKAPAFFENPIKYVSDEQIFVIRRNENFINNIVVGCYAQRDEIDKLAYLGVVNLVQEKVIQIKIRVDYKVLDKVPLTIEELKNIIIRPVVPMSAFEQINTEEA